MSGVVLPLPDPPADDVAELVRLLDFARGHLRAAEWRRDRLLELAGVNHPSSTAVRVMKKVRAYEVDVWAEEVRALEEHARSMGLQP